MKQENKIKFTHIVKSYVFNSITKKWELEKTENFGIVYQKNVDLAFSKENRKFFKSLGAKESYRRVGEDYSITSISPTGKEKRYHKFERIA